MDKLKNTLRFYFALWFSQGTRLFMHLLRRNATFFPGKLALKICPDFLSRIGKPEKVIAVTGTNGKTTTCNLLIDVLKINGVKALNNQMGSNTAAGIASSLLGGANIFGRSRYKVAVLEVDERSSLRVYPFVRPDIICITNLSTDSIMRNAHPQYIAGIIESAVPEGTMLVLNADDLISCRIAPENPRAYFGIAHMDTDVTECHNLVNDLRACPICSGELVYEYRRYHHIGRARCADCGFSSPNSDYLAKDVDLYNMTMRIVDKNASAEYNLLADSVFNIYNMVTVIAIMRELGYSHDAIRAGFDGSKIVSSRYNEVTVHDVTVIMHMSKDKNAYACSRAFDYVSSHPGRKEILLMVNCLMDQIESSENVSWMYCCDFEFLNDPGITRIVCAGPRALDLRLRLLFAGIPEERIRCVQDEMDAPPLFEFAPGESVYMFYGTDELNRTFAVRDALCRRIREVYSK